MLDVLVTLSLASHLLAMNVAGVGPLVGAWAAGPLPAATSRRIWILSLVALTVGALLGGLLLLAPNESLRLALRRFPAQAYWFAGAELLFSATCLAGLIAASAKMAQRPILRWAIALLSASNLLYHFPPLMAVMGELASDPQWTHESLIDRAALLELWRRPEILSLWVHFALASFAIGPIAVAWLADGGDGAFEESGVSRKLGACALIASGLQIPAGLWLLSTARADARDSLLGSELWPTACFAGGILAALALMQSLLAVAIGEGRPAIKRSAYLALGVTVLMTATLRHTRSEPSSEVRRPLSSAREEARPPWDVRASTVFFVGVDATSPLRPVLFASLPACRRGVDPS